MNGKFRFNFKVLILSIIRIILHFYMKNKWEKDKDRHNLPIIAKDDYISASLRHWLKNREFPIVRGDSFNDLVFTQKVVDRDPLRIICCDKLGVRNYVESKLGTGYLADIYFSGDDLLPSQWESLPNQFVVKVNHDSGGVWIVRDKSTSDGNLLRKYVSDALKKRYGDIEGEWPYRYVLPKVFVEELLGVDVAPADYKFHCINGVVCWVQYIFSREAGGKEVVVSRDGSLLGMALSPDLQSSDSFEIPEAWGDMLRAATVLSEDFEYVRVDMYAIGKRVVVGELTFFPLAGLYPVNVSRRFGKLLRDECTGALDV